MSSVLKWVGVATALIVVANSSAKAQTPGAFALTDTSPITVQGWTITLSGCGVSGTTTCAGSEVIPTVENTTLGITLSLVFESISGGALQTNLAGATGSDLSLSSIAIVAPTGEQIYETQVNVSGSDATQPARVTVGDTLRDGVVTETTLSTSLANSPTLQSETFAPNNTVDSNTDFRVGSSTFTAAGTMSTATLTYTAAPEPVSSSLLVVGIAGLGFVRRKIRRTS
jgi:phospholipase/lecithinase/hemolysin